jgi:uncharacterized OB-fold protein
MKIPHHWRLKEQRYGLTGTVCTGCGKRFFTPRPVCDVCSTPSSAVDDRFEHHSSRREHVYEPAQR